MKILFLDIDGVCNSSDYAISKGERPGVYDIDPVAAARVKRIVEATGCKVVLSSTWRLDADSREQVKKHVCEFIGVTMDLPSAWRGEEIRCWLLDNVKRDELQAYAILDDDADFNPDQPLFKTSFKTGLTDDIADAVIRHLNGA